MHKVLYLTYDGLTDPLGQSQVLPYVLELSRQGFSFVILSCEKPDVYKKNKGIIEKLLEGTDVKWVPVFYTKKPPVLSGVYNYLKLKRRATSLHLKNNFQLVHCRGPLVSLIGDWMKIRYKVKFLFDMRGFWADERVDGGIWDLNKIVYRKVFHFFKRKEKEFLEKADHIVSLTHAGKKEMDSEYRCSSLVFIFIMVCIFGTFRSKSAIEEGNNGYRLE